MDKQELLLYKKETDYNLAQLEVDYFQNLILKILFEKYNTLYFKGGTCLQKCYNIKRFSEDLDFNYKDINIKELLNYLQKKINYKSKIREIHKTKFGYSITILFEGVLYEKTPNSMCKIVLDFREKDIFLEPIKKMIFPIYSNITRYFLLALNKDEILAEKIRALMTRHKARDVFDLNELLIQNVKINLELINKKLKTYNLIFNLKEFTKKIDEKRSIYEREMNSLIKVFPSFSECRKNILNNFRKKV